MAINFPCWLTADVILPALVERYSRIAVEGDGDRVIISFLDPMAMQLVPPEDRDMFVRLYNEFAALMSRLIRLGAIFAKYEYLANDQVTRYSMKRDIELVLDLLQQETGHTYKEILLYMLLNGEEKRKQFVERLANYQISLPNPLEIAAQVAPPGIRAK
jgi:hypothetical protein